MSRAARATTLAAYRDGITVICELAVQFTDATWLAQTPCAEWRAVDLAGHLRCVADDYHEYLDDAPDSRLARLMATGVPADSLARKLARQNAAELAALPDAPGKEHIGAFAESARAYGRRLALLTTPGAWDQPHHTYRGHVVTVGAMAGLACAEWHLHAWDLARALGKDYRPADPRLVREAWRSGGPRQWSQYGLGGAVLESGDPWDVLLGASGRDPAWVPV
jgi:hypothetical protein